MEALKTFRAELEGCGLRSDVIEALCVDYERALHGEARDWNRFYHELFAALSLLSASAAQPDKRCLGSMLLILEDDLGAQLFGCNATQELRARFAEPAYALN